MFRPSSFRPSSAPRRRQPSARRLLAGATAARTGDEMSGPALLLLGHAWTGSAAGASALLAAVTAASALGGPLFGVLHDRAARPGRLLAWALTLYATGLTVVLAGLAGAPFPLTLFVALATGLLAPALAGGWTAQLGAAVPAERLPRAHALDAATFSAASLLGPALAGLLSRWLGAPAAVVAATALILLAVPATRGLPHRAAGPETARAHADRTAEADRAEPVRAEATRPDPARTEPARPDPVRGEPAPAPADRGTNPDWTDRVNLGGVGRDLARGFGCVLRSVPLARATLGTTLSSLGQGVFVACVPLLGERLLGGPGDGALLLAATALAALGTNLSLARRRCPLVPDTVLAAAPLLLAVAFATAGLAAGPGAGAGTGVAAGPLGAAALLAGIAEGPQLTALFAVRHRETPERLRAQVSTTGAGVKISAFALGAAVGGPLAVRSLPGALGAAAAVQVLAAAAHRAVGRAPGAYARVVRKRRRRRAARRCGRGPARG
ncbi:MFS transporter [Streptomyces sp. NPDC048717]|uniref:MFS transporter n=1 Tax=Streptomyces sp. NPDC048717 TaxID=3154928 RepID=UPI0034200141